MDRFDEVLTGLLSLREATELQFQKLEASMDAKFAIRDIKFDRFERYVHQQFTIGGERLDRLEGKVDRLEGKVDRLEGKFDALEGKVAGLQCEMREGFAGVNRRLDRLERHRGARG